MKTKIIYISGGEIFDMNDIHAAFNQIRDALNLTSDTVLFGVPVDASDALANGVTQIPSVALNIAPTPIAEPDVSDIIKPAEIEPILADDQIQTPETETPVSEIEIENIEPVVESIPAPKKARGRPKSVKKATPAPIIDDVTPSDITTIDAPTDTAQSDTPNVASILSVLTYKTDESVESDDTDIDTADVSTATVDVEQEINADEIVATPDEYSVAAEEITNEFETIETTDTISPVDMDAPEDVESMIAEDAPAAPMEKTLEQLLESMTPLREDIEHEHMMHSDMPEPEFDNFDKDSASVSDTDIMDTDITLEQLATEFAENQDKIEPAQKTENHGKIGKLKNILPFKKARRDDTGLMGDLFGWAGIAANDEDFTIPGFFTNAASKK